MDRAPLWLRRTFAPAAAVTLAIMVLLAPSDANAQRRRRRHRESNPTTTSSQTQSTGSQTTTTTTTTTGGTATTGGATTTTTATSAATTAGTTTTATSAATSAASGATTDTTARTDTHVEPPPPPVPVPAPDQTPGMRPAAIDFQVGPRLFGRSLWFTDDLFNQLRPYLVIGAPGVAAALEWYPGAHFTTGAGSMFGIIAHGDYNFVLASTDAQGRSYPTTSYGFDVGARVRYVFARRADLGVAVSYVRTAFTIDRANVIAPPEGIMSVTYQSIRVGLSGRVMIVPRVAITGSFGGMYVLDPGEIGTTNYFPRMTAGGVDFGLGAAFSITSWFEVRLNLDWRRYFMAMNPMRNDPLIAGGAIDDYFAATISVAARR